jgi:hypothetical protein
MLYRWHSGSSSVSVGKRFFGKWNLSYYLLHIRNINPLEAKSVVAKRRVHLNFTKAFSLSGWSISSMW